VSRLAFRVSRPLPDALTNRFFGGGCVPASHGQKRSARLVRANRIARACNRLAIERWLEEDSRLRGSVLLACQVPEVAADEIRHVGPHPQIVQAIFASNPHGYAFGHPIYDAIHRAAADTGLPLAIHSLGEAGAGCIAEPGAGGRLNYHIEYSTAGTQAMMTHVMSFIANGVFERYPTLTVVLLEAGINWIPPFLRRCDQNFRSATRSEIPLCKKLPSTYFMEHIRVGTQPLDIDSPRDPMWAVHDATGVDTVAMFASDYPHWDTDDPKYMRGRFPERWRQRVLWQNAAALYGLDITA
jgi:predicted TIM-barrel fold metal-dependent hydrolase